MTPLKSFHGAVIGPLTATNISQFLPKCHEKCMGHSKWTAPHCVHYAVPYVRSKLLKSFTVNNQQFIIEVSLIIRQWIKNRLTSRKTNTKKCR